MSTDPLVLELDEAFTSGETLARKLGVSRVAVHKRVQRMVRAGYPVETGPRGYRWRPGTPAPKPLLRRYAGPLLAGARYIAEAASTQDAARALAEECAAEGTLVVAERQSEGRGRRGRAWLSPAGGLYFSLVLRPEVPLAALPLVSLAAGAALAEAAGVGGLKWPNDLLDPDGRKLAGVLVEADLRGEEVRYLVLGVGVNLDPPGLEGASGLRAFTRASRADVLARFLTALEPLYLTLPDPGPVLAAWRARSVTLGRPVRVHTPAGPKEGTAVDLEEDGSLVLQTPRGRQTRVSAGDVEWIGGFA
jgi:BirA family biotin operon repressor/biotin-[acetyl-CoA-carboxylase] ligase